jgi:hypothetical protein
MPTVAVYLLERQGADLGGVLFRGAGPFGLLRGGRAAGITLHSSGSFARFIAHLLDRD